MQKRFLFSIVLVVSITGCNSFRKITDGPSSTPGWSAPAPDYTIKGKTEIDYQYISPVRVANSTVTVKVLRPGETVWRVCNKYEALVSASGAGSVRFDTQVNFIGGWYYVTNVPVAPIGTLFEIRSVLN